MGRKHGYEFESEVLKSMEQLRTTSKNPIIYHKLVDTYAYDWVAKYIDEPPKNLTVKQTAQFKYNMILPKVPCDIIFAYKGSMILIECKSSKNLKGFPIANIKQHQLEASEEWEACEIPYYFFLCRREARHNQLFVVRGSVMRDMIHLMQNGKLVKTRIPWDLIETNSEIVLPKGKGCVFDLSFLIEDKSIKEVKQHGIKKEIGQAETERPIGKKQTGKARAGS